MITFHNNDLFTTNANILINPVNCIGVMGKGIAIEFKKRYPEMFQDYQKTCKNNQLQPGILHIWKDQNITIINLPTKRHWRDPSEYHYIIEGLKALQEYLSNHKNTRIAIPAIGCGNGGLEWKIVSEYIKEILSELDADILVSNPQK